MRIHLNILKFRKFDVWHKWKWFHIRYEFKLLNHPWIFCCGSCNCQCWSKPLNENRIFPAWIIDIDIRFRQDVAIPHFPKNTIDLRQEYYCGNKDVNWLPTKIIWFGRIGLFSIFQRKIPLVWLYFGLETKQKRKYNISKTDIHNSE